MSIKGLIVLKGLLERFDPTLIAYVVTAQDTAIEQDYHDEIRQLAQTAKIKVYQRKENSGVLENASHLLAVSWRWMLTTKPDQKLIVFHDSILPRYRGFAPLVSALVNGDACLGVTALVGSSDYDRGPIIGRQTVQVTYPLKIVRAIEILGNCYRDLATETVGKILTGTLTSVPQDDTLASYSLWRDEADYFIDWNWPSTRIQRFVDAVGFPYKGAATAANGVVFRITEVTAVPDVTIENRTPGKIIFLCDKEPVVVCGQGLLRIHGMVESQTRKNALPLKNFRTCFHTPPRA
jgi:methionyl-tRNA formyltransferase